MQPRREQQQQTAAVGNPGDSFATRYFWDHPRASDSELPSVPRSSPHFETPTPLELKQQLNSSYYEIKQSKVNEVNMVYTDNKQFPLRLS